MALTYTAFKDKIEALLEDSTNTNFAAAALDNPIADACKEAGSLVPHLVAVPFTIESRTGTVSSTSANNLVDASESQFVSSDAGKVVYNRTDKTWAVITAYTSATTVALSKDIMASGENYEIYNAGCTQNNQINISDVDEYMDIDYVEYPVGHKRNFELNGTILTIKANYIYDSKVLTSGDQPYTEVVVWFKKRHLISQLTDFAGAVNNAGGYAAGATSMAINNLQTTGTIEQGQEFTVADIRGIYTVTADATIAANAATVSFFPALESAVANTVVVTFTRSTLTPKLEPVVVQLAAGLAATSKPMNPYQQTLTAITSLSTANTAIGAIAARITQAVADVASARTALALGVTAITEADTEFDLINPEVDLAKTEVALANPEVDDAKTKIASALTELNLVNTEIDLAKTALSSGNSLINTIPVAGGAGEYMGQASADAGVGQGYLISGQGILQSAQAALNLARGYLESAGGYQGTGRGYHESGRAYLEKAAADNANASGYLTAGLDEVRASQAKAQEAQASMQKAERELAITRSGQIMEQWGRPQVKEARTKLLAIGGLTTSVRFPRD